MKSIFHLLKFRFVSVIGCVVVWNTKNNIMANTHTKNMISSQSLKTLNVVCFCLLTNKLIVACKKCWWFVQVGRILLFIRIWSYIFIILAYLRCSSFSSKLLILLLVVRGTPRLYEEKYISIKTKLYRSIIHIYYKTTYEAHLSSMTSTRSNNVIFRL